MNRKNLATIEHFARQVAGLCMGLYSAESKSSLASLRAEHAAAQKLKGRGQKLLNRFMGTSRQRSIAECVKDCREAEQYVGREITRLQEEAGKVEPRGRSCWGRLIDLSAPLRL
jgi:hypothetical protein